MHNSMNDLSTGLESIDSSTTVAKATNNGKHWSEKDRNTLIELLQDGLKVSDISLLLNRSEGAISRVAAKLGYGTSEITGVKTLTANIERRDRTEKETNTNSQESVMSESLSNKSDDSLSNSELVQANNGLEVNTIVIDMFQENNIVITPKIVYELSTHIIQTQGVQV